MNYLAHLHITYPRKALSFGNLIGDMVRLRDMDALDESTISGIQIHRAIDNFVDNHDASRFLVRKLRRRHGKYAPVVLDIVFDHVLCSHWQSFESQLQLPDFIAWAYEVIDFGIGSVPDHVSGHLAHMYQFRWFDNYGSADGFAGILRGMDRRARFESNFHMALEDVKENRDLMVRTLGVLLSDTRSHLNAML